MKNAQNVKRGLSSLVIVASLTFLALIAGPAAVSADYLPGPVAAVTSSAGRLDFEPNNSADAMTLTVSGANGAYYRASHAPGDPPSFALVDNDGNSFPDGAASYELQVNPDAGVRGDVKGAPEEGASQSGGFSVVDGAIVLSAGGGGGPNGDSDPSDGPALEDQVILDDLIVDGSICAGQDCVNGESFGFDTIRIKENNLRIRAVDTSSTSSFPSNDWQLTFNDSSNGGKNKFSLDDIDGGKTPFTVEAGAPSNSLYVESTGDIGVNTSTPVVELHIVDGDSPTLRLEQNGSSGFTPQTWDVAGNETNFFVRDVTNGSKLAFKIKPGAPDNSVFIAADGKVGLGTASPGHPLHVKTGNGVSANIVAEREDGATVILSGGSSGFIGTKSDHDVRYMVNNTTVMTLDKENLYYVGIGAGMTNPSHPIELGAHANGAYLTTSGNWTSTSSREFKENIHALPVEKAFDALDKLDPVTFSYKKEKGESYVGFIAEDVPELVAMETDRQRLMPMDIVAVLTKVVQEQQKIIAENSATIAELKNEIQTR